MEGKRRHHGGQEKAPWWAREDHQEKPDNRCPVIHSRRGTGGRQRGRLNEEAKGETKVGDQRVDQRRRLKGEAKGGGQREGASLVTHDAM